MKRHTICSEYTIELDDRFDIDTAKRLDLSIDCCLCVNDYNSFNKLYPCVWYPLIKNQNNQFLIDEKYIKEHEFRKLFISKDEDLKQKINRYLKLLIFT